MDFNKDYLKDLFIDEVKGCLEGDSSLPKVTSKDDGKILKVVDGTWQLVDLVPPLYLSFLGNAEFTLGAANNTKNWDGTLEYSTDKKAWSEWDGTAISSAGNNLYLRGTGNTRITGNSADYGFVFTGTDTLKIACKGNIENLLDYATVRSGEHPTMAEYCYQSMFQGCTTLATAPELPATTLDKYCYQYMFSDCTTLTTAPELPATTLAADCYSSMFAGCITLTTAPSLPATTLAASCYSSMFAGCRALTTAPSLPATTLAKYCYQYMFSDCTKIKLSTTQTGDYQTEYRIPTTGAGTTATGALTGMFANTGGTFTGSPYINTIYYTSNTVV